jgi:hypothetical protein
VAALEAELETVKSQAQRASDSQKAAVARAEQAEAQRCVAL